MKIVYLSTGSEYYYYVLASDNYRVRVQYPSTSGATQGGSPQTKTVAAACYSGSCEAKAITSVLTVRIPGLVANVQLKIFGSDEWSEFLSQTNTVKYCVFNLVNTEVYATFRAGQTIERKGINCETVNQKCDAGIFTSVLCPDFGCLTNPETGPSSVQYIIYHQQFGIVHQVFKTKKKKTGKFVFKQKKMIGNWSSCRYSDLPDRSCLPRLGCGSD